MSITTDEAGTIIIDADPDETVGGIALAVNGRAMWGSNRARARTRLTPDEARQLIGQLEARMLAVGD
ncbi:MAG: hypothetical protein V7607_1196 [Solirubrobacteraceae bacterium]